jgi:hypothetical protein
MVLSAAGALSACGGGGGGGTGAPAPSATYTVSGTVSGMAGGTLVLLVNGSDVSATANGSLVLASGLSNGSAYAVSVKTQPATHTCTVANGSGNIASANVSSVQVACVENHVSIASPADDVLVPLAAAQEIQVTFAGTSADRLTWTVLPAGIAANATVTAVSSTATSAVVSFSASVADDYTVRVTNQDDPSKVSEVEIRVHDVYTHITGKSQRRAFLRADGQVHSDMVGAPTAAAIHIATGYRQGVAALADGTVVAWGDVIRAPVPSGLTGVKAVAAGSYFAMAQKADDTLTIWGHLNNDAVMAAEVVGAKVLDFDASLSTMQVVKEDGSMVVWSGDSGNLHTLPAAWQGRKFKKVCGTGWHVVAVDEAGAVYSWNPVNTGDPALDTPPATSGPVAAVFCGDSHAALVQEDGRVLTWGEDLGSNGAFDSNTVSGFPRIKDASFYTYGDPAFLTEGGAVIDRNGQLVRDLDDL